MTIDQAALAAQLAGEVGRLLGEWRRGDGTTIPSNLSRVLFDFSEAGRGESHYSQAGEVARSLAILLDESGDEAVDDRLWAQIQGMVDSLLSLLAGSEAAPGLHARVPLVTPIAPSRERASQSVCLYLDNAGLAAVLHEALQQAGYSVIDIVSLPELLRYDRENYPAAIIADLDLCQLDPASADVFATLRQRFNPPPHVFCLAGSEDIPARLQAVRLGATRFFAKPLDIGRVIAVLKGVTAQTPAKPFRVLLVEDDRMLGEMYRLALMHAGVEALVMHNPLRVPEAIHRFSPDVVVSDIYMPGCNGLELLAVLRQDDRLADTPIIFLSSDNDRDCQLEALDLGGDDFLSKPVDMPLFVATVLARAKKARALKRSRSEYRRLLERTRELESQLPFNYPASDEDLRVEALMPVISLLEGYEVSETETGAEKRPD